MEKLRQYSLLLLLMLTAVAATAKTDERVPENRVIYEVFVRNFGATNSRVGTLQDVTAQLDRLKNMGVDVVWLMPLYTEGNTDKWGTYSSPYAVKNYTEVDPKYGTLNDLKALVNAAHQRGMLVWLDWVANHTSTDAVWTSNHKDYYVNGNNGFYHPSGWNDVYELEYASTAMRNAMIDAMKYWVREADIDGFRLDNTDGVPNDFWLQCRTELDNYATSLGKSLEWLAETGNNNLYNFDNNNSRRIMDVFGCNYAWSFADYLRSIGSGVNVSGIAGKVAELHNDNTYRNKTRMMYLANHDVQQDKGGTPDKFFGANLKPMTVLYFTCYGMPMIYNGQEVKNSTGSEMLAEKYTINWNGNDDGMTALFTKLAYLKHTEPALRTGSQSGQLINHTCSNGNVYVYERRSGSSSVVVMLNFGGSSASFNVSSELLTNNYVEAFTGTSQNFGSNKSFTLGAHGYAVWTIADGSTPDIPDPKTYTITLYRPYGWDNVPHAHVYYVQDANTDVDLISNQPMTLDNGSVAHGVYTITLPEPPAGATYNVMFNNGGWENGQSSEIAESTPGDYEYTINTDKATIRYAGKVYDLNSPTPGGDDPDPSGHYIYILDETGYDALGLYGWSMTEPELFGGWPGNTEPSSRVVNGFTFKAFAIPADKVGKEYSLIVNNAKRDGESGKAQLPDYGVTLNGDIFLIATSTGVTPFEYTITFYPHADWTNTPHAHVYYASGGKDVDHITNTPMRVVATAASSVPLRAPSRAYVIHLPALPEGVDGYNVMFNNGGWEGGQSTSFAETQIGNYAYTISKNGTEYTTKRYTGTTDLDAPVVEVEDVDVIYFDIYGRRVSTPGNGLFIRSDGKKVWIR